MKWLHKIKCVTYNRMYFLSGLFGWGRAYVVDIAQLVRAPDCDSGGRRFESGYPPHFYIQAKMYNSIWRVIEVGTFASAACGR